MGFSFYFFKMIWMPKINVNSDSVVDPSFTRWDRPHGQREQKRATLGHLGLQPVERGGKVVSHGNFFRAGTFCQVLGPLSFDDFGFFLYLFGASKVLKDFHLMENLIFPNWDYQHYQ